MQYIDAGVLGAFKARQVTRKWRYCNTVAIEVYCDCRGIEEGDMIECNKCKEWYHKECCKVAPKYFIESEDTEWSCMSCK